MGLALCRCDAYVANAHVANAHVANAHVANAHVANDCHPNVTKSIYCEAVIVDILKRGIKPAITWVI